MSKQDSIDLVKSQFDRAYFLFYTATIVTAISVSVTLLGAGEMLIGNPQGTQMMLGGLHASINSMRIARSAIDRVKKISD
jgi:hypothetical protein